jgi:hypothetical protein
VSDMTKPDEIESEAVLETGNNVGARLTGRASKVLAFARLRRALEPARSVLAGLGPLGAALWAIYPVAIVLLVIGFLFAGAGSVGG